jgi:hypothetical protein
MTKWTAAFSAAGLTCMVLAAAATGDTQRHIAPLHFRLGSGTAVAAGCTKRIPDSWKVATWVHVNGANLQVISRGNAQYYAGDGTLVRLTPEPHGGPICAKADTWLRVAHVTVTFRVL